MVKNINILLLEDNPDDQVLFVAHLKKTRFNAVNLSKSTHLKEGLRMLAENEYDMVMLDLSLPDSFGLDGLDQVRKLHPFIPIVILTGMDEAEMAVKAIQAGAQDYLQKEELNTFELEKTIAYAFERAKVNKQDQEETIEELREARDKLQKQQEILEGALRREKELGELRRSFISEASHHFRTPLAVIQSNLELLLSSVESKSEKQQKLFNKINNRVQNEILRITGIMDGLLHIADQPNALHEKDLSLVDVVAFCQRDLTHAQDDGRTLALQVVGEPRPMMLCESRLKEVVGQFTDNAFRYSEGKKAPVLTLDYRDAEELVLQVEDFGIGIPEGEEESIFQPFFRGSNVGATKGSGLGLAIASKYINDCGGSVSVKSHPGHTTFSLHIPAPKDIKLEELYDSEERRPTVARR